MSLCVAGADILTDANATFRRGAVLIEKGRIAAVGYGDDANALKARAASTTDANGLALIPGFVNAHHHSYANALRGTENALPLELWALYTVAYGRNIDEKLLRLAILTGAAEMLRNGVTGVIDHSPPVRRAAASFAAHVESGMRVGFAPFFHDTHDHDLLGFDLPPALRAGVEGLGFPPADLVADIFAQLAAADGGARVHVLLGPNAPQRCSPGLLDIWARLRARHGFGSHTHLLETRAQAIACARHWPDGIVVEMDRRGLLDERLAVAHGVWLTPKERDLLAARGVTVVHNPASNLMLGSGVLPSADLGQRGVRLALGSDSANTGGSADPFELMRLATMIGRVGIGRVGTDWDSWLDAKTAFAMATEGGATAMGLGGEIGRIETGRLADLVLVDMAGAASTAPPSVETLVRHGGPASVRATMVGGAWVYRDGRVLAFDEANIRRELIDAAAEFSERCADELSIAREAHRVFDPQLRALLGA
jgi:cytosine/adenosine deaminase-related metal-dependent hydrolase